MQRFGSGWRIRQRTKGEQERGRDAASTRSPKGMVVERDAIAQEFATGSYDQAR
jgi:hypothetical protein